MQRAEQRSFLVAPLSTVFRSVFSVAFSSDCRICSLPLRNISGLPVCQECLDSIEPVRPPLRLEWLLRTSALRRRLVPVRSSKRCDRRFNRAGLIVGSTAKRLPQRLEVATVLQCRRATHSQLRLRREERIANVRGAFRISDSDRVKGRTVIVVDDVMTTGTTVSECARAKKAGAERVWAATVARILKEAAPPPVPVERSKEEEGEAAEMAVSV